MERVYIQRDVQIWHVVSLDSYCSGWYRADKAWPHSNFLFVLFFFPNASSVEWRMKRETDGHSHSVKVCSISAAICMNVRTTHAAKTLQILSGDDGVASFLISPLKNHFFLFTISCTQTEMGILKLHYIDVSFTFLSRPHNVICDIQCCSLSENNLLNTEVGTPCLFGEINTEIISFTAYLPKFINS